LISDLSSAQKQQDLEDVKVAGLYVGVDLHKEHHTAVMINWC